MRVIICFFGLLLVVEGAGWSESRHSPLYSLDTDWKVTAVFRVTSPDEMIREIQIKIVEGIPTDCSELGRPASIVPCRKNARTYTHVCQYKGSRFALCTFPPASGRPPAIQFSAAQISYQAKAVTNNREIDDREVTFSSRLAATTNFATPIWWHRNLPKRSCLNLGFFPAADYVGAKAFPSALNGLMEQVFFGGMPFAQTFSRSRHVFNLWVAPSGVTISGAVGLIFPRTLQGVKSILDGSVILHNTNGAGFYDSSSISFGGEGSVFAPTDSSTSNPWILVHESGHFLFALGDEYAGGGHKTPIKYPCDGSPSKDIGCTNVFECMRACEDFARLSSLDPGKCKALAYEASVFRLDSQSPEIMQNDNLESNWRLASRACVNRVIASCRAGTCYPGRSEVK